MKTDDLIEALAAGLEPSSPGRVKRDLAVASAVAMIAAVIGVLVLLGLRPDLDEAVGAVRFWLKVSYTGGLALTGGWLLMRVGRPGASVRAPLATLLVVVATAVGLTAVEQLLLPVHMRPMAWLGHSASDCSRNILMLTLFAAPFVFWGARRLAPTRPALAGAAAGLLAGGLAATAYGLRCPEVTASFVTAWYTLGVLLAAAAGAVIGRFLLRW